MRVLCVAEKPSAARKIAEILSQNSFTTENTSDVHIKNYIFTYNLNNRPTTFVMTALKGHAMQIRFAGDINNNWHLCAIEDLFQARITKVVPENMQPLMNNIRNQIQRADVLFVWTDCDREGEAIGGDLADYCRSIKPNISVWRARFSAMQAADIHRAAQHHDELDMKQILAVRARSELDLRIGAAFTRFQTLQLRSYFQNNSNSNNKVLSYGSCQFPTLGFVVDRYLQHENFIQEEFWKIHMVYKEERENGEPPLSTTFKWRKEHLFDRWACLLFYEMCYEAKIARVTKVKAKETQKWKPLPLTTVELQKVACRALHMSGHEIMVVAEGLYNQGFISYPRTETDQFEPGFDFHALIEKQVPDPQWGQYARILKDGDFQRPRNGRNNDKAHPPIHPTAYTNSLTGPAKKVYEFITRRFLACCWKNAIGYETSIEVQMGPEFFDTKGLVILERNYLDVYPYDKWTGNVIPEFQEGDEFVPEILEMVSGHTTPPNLLTETDLISMMEKNEIGTDATIAEHIQKILDREYVFKQGPYFKPLSLGIALILGYDQIGFESSLSKPFMRRKMEADLKAICLGNKQSNEVLSESLENYLNMFMQLRADFSIIRRSMDEHFRQDADRQSAASRESNRGSRGGGYGGGNNNDDDDNNHNQGRSGGRGGRGGRGSRGGRGGRGSRGSASATRESRGSSRGGRGAGRGRGNVDFNSSTTSRRAPGVSNEEPPKCEHDMPMILRTVTKAGPNNGKQFFSCANSNQCKSFVWLNSPAPSFGNGFGARNSGSSSFGGLNSMPNPNCNCHKPSVERFVSKDSPNKGRGFYTCSAPQGSGCDYFQWADEI